MGYFSKNLKAIRQQHYWFVQGILYHYIKDSPMNSMIMFRVAKDSTKLKQLWDFTHSAILERYPDVENVDSESLSHSTTIFSHEESIAVVTLPKPQAMTESYYIGIYYNLFEIGTEPEFRYFTLEYHDEEKTALCELSEGRHSLMGFGEKMSSEEFLERIKQIVNK